MHLPIRCTLLTALLVFCVACQKKDPVAMTTGPAATVLLRNGSRMSGAVLQSSPAQITLEGPDGTTRVFEMRDVRTVEYGEAPPLASPPAAARTERYDDRTSSPQRAQERRPDDRRTSERLAPAHEDGPPTPPRYHPEENHISTRSFVVPAGSKVEVRTDETIDSRNSSDGQTYAAEIYRDVLDTSGNVVLPQGANAQLAVRSATRGGRITGSSDLLLDLVSVSVGGRRYSVVSSDLDERGKQGVGANRRTAEYVGGTSALGAIIGAIAGQGRGAAIGAASGAGAGAVAEVLTHGSSVHIPAETLLTFQLAQPLQIAPR